jgi:hypothetical protein
LRSLLKRSSPPQNNSANMIEWSSDRLHPKHLVCTCASECASEALMQKA